MTQIQSIQENIHYTKVQLNKYRSVIIKDELQRLHIEAAIEATLQELKDLNFCLECAIKQASK